MESRTFSLLLLFEIAITIIFTMPTKNLTGKDDDNQNDSYAIVMMNLHEFHSMFQTIDSIFKPTKTGKTNPFVVAVLYC